MKWIRERIEVRACPRSRYKGHMKIGFQFMSINVYTVGRVINTNINFS